MSSSSAVALVALGAVVVVLLLGIGNMARAGAGNTSQLLMRWRVGLQFIALVVIMSVLWWRGG